MPYIKKKDRLPVVTDGPTNAGELNYILTMEYVSYLAGSNINYAAINKVVGALDNALSIFLDDGLFHLDRDSILTLAFSKIIMRYAESQRAEHDPDVRDEVVGAVRCCQLELYRRIISPYEEIKIRENGDVFPKFMLTPK